MDGSCRAINELAVVTVWNSLSGSVQVALNIVVAAAAAAAFLWLK